MLGKCFKAAHQLSVDKEMTILHELLQLVA